MNFVIWIQCIIKKNNNMINENYLKIFKLMQFRHKIMDWVLLKFIIIIIIIMFKKKKLFKFRLQNHLVKINMYYRISQKLKLNLKKN